MEGINREFLPYMIVIAIVSVGLELLISKNHDLRNYEKNESLISVAIFFMGTLTNSLFRLAVGAISVWCYQHRFFELPLNGAMQFGAAFFLVEFCYYWMHRYSHEVRLGWASHVVHHSPECFNLSIAYRLGVTGFFSLLWLFFIPLAWLGFRPEVTSICLSLNLFYQFWLHTELIPKLGWLEWLFNTPSHHRVHHASNPLYLDRNYGGVLIVFDRLFGTFQEERSDIKIKYGLTEKIAIKSILNIAFMGWLSLWHDIKLQRRIIDKIKLIIFPPGWAPNGTEMTSKMMRSQWTEHTGTANKA